MSRLAREINAQLTNGVKAKQMRYVTIDTHEAPRNQFSLARGVNLSVTFRHTAWLDEQLTNKPQGEQYVEAIMDIKRAIVEDVFGEFRPLIIEMRNALYDADTTRLRKLIAELENQMFVEGM